MFRQVFKREEDLAPPREPRKRSRDQGVPAEGESVKRIKMESDTAAIPSEARKRSRDQGVPAEGESVKRIKMESDTAAIPSEGNGGFQQANVPRPFPRCRRRDGYKCTTCGKQYRVEGWLHRHYRKFPTHDPAEIQRREEQRREEQRKRMREAYFRALVAEYEQKEAAKARRRPQRRQNLLPTDVKMSGDQVAEQFVIDLLQFLRSSKLYTDLFNAAQNEAFKPSLRVSDLRKGVQAGLINGGWDRKLRNTIYHYMHTHPRQPPQPDPDHNKEPLLYMRKAQQAWEKKILKSLNSMCTELNIPLARRRPDRDQKDMSSRWTELGTDGPDLSQIRPVYAPKDFLEVVAALQNTNYQNCVSNGGSFYHFWGTIQVPIKLKSINQLRVQYSEMSINQCQTGVDDYPDIPPELFDTDRSKLGHKVLAASHALVAREFSKKGCPTSMRGELWCQMMGVEVDEVDILYYEQLKNCVLQHDLLVDNLLYKDVKLTATNDDHYFVFEDYLYQVLLPFSRDTVVLKHFSHNSATPPKSYIRGKLGVDEFSVIYPPNGVIPFHGFAMYVAPLCYVYKDVVTLYYVFRRIYTQYFFRLHSVSSHPQGIVALSLLFETLLQTREPELFFHLKNVGCQPLKIAFKWLMRAFSGFLASDQVLLLWDRILSFDSLEILPVFAVAIFSFRKTNLMKVQTYNAAEAVLADVTTLQVVPLLQLALFSK